ncbi:ammonium transporter [Methanocorpusculum labreanum Z]|uniref:Ammonium transporter n=1 Tax=Methanocorpusculum labreanum (strain ATCC 43576 / DSM 4855 / Z) TaxID=410358 RepID=A2SPS8_METLZ|nr:ammonium transporter [Methanocorpusculum labreanum]ABN06334.1 ammonium transporter [Methanocorpusculum labreanum Z]
MDLDTGATAWVLISAALVLMMVPAVGLFYGGMVRKKNVISTMMLSFVALALGIVQWIIIGYSLAFGADVAGVIGWSLDYIGLSGVPIDGVTGGIPDILFICFQMMFACLALAILTSGIVGRVKMSSYIVVGLLWLTLVYAPLAHWAWGGGWAYSLGALDFAGGTVVHISSGFAALALALVIGKRVGYGKQMFRPHNIPMTLIGGMFLIVGWFGFNAGSALAANQLAASAFLVTAAAAATGALTWMALSWKSGKPNSLGFISGAIAGLVGITPAAGYVNVGGGLLIGIITAAVCYAALSWRIKAGLDESLDAWAIHGMGGFAGAILTGVFAVSAICGVGGLLEGNVMQFGIQILDAVIAVVYAFGMTFIIGWIINKTMGLRATEDEEYIGMDLAQHGEQA